MKNFLIIEAPSNLGLKPSGVETSPKVLLSYGLQKKLSARHIGSVAPARYSWERDPLSKLLNAQQISKFSVSLANKIGEIINNNAFVLVLGGDCSILIGCALALRRSGEYGLVFLDGHADFYQPSESPTGEVADMDLAIVTGRGPEILTNIENLKPFVKDSNVIAFGYRDQEEQRKYQSQDLKDTRIMSIELEKIKNVGIRAATSEILVNLMNKKINGFWIHLDVDVLDDNIMPAVDYRMPGGLTFEELSQALEILMSSKKAVGMDVTIFNPKKDLDGSIGRALVDTIVKGLTN